MFVSAISKEEIKKIHEASLKILERTGVEVPHEEVLSRFADSGAKVDLKTKRVRIPSDLVEKSVKSARKSYTLYGRDLSKKAEFGAGKRNYNSIAGEALIVDEIGGERRYTSLDDVKKAVILADALDKITIPGAMSDPAELPVEWRCVAVAAEMLRHTAKPVTFWFHDRASAKYLVDMVIAMRGDEKKAEEFPPFYPFFEPISPLRFPVNGIDLLFETARINLPVPIGPMAQTGLSAPCSVAGTMAQENAEILAGVCITQLIRPGMPVCYGGICHAFDMSTTQMIFSGPEQCVFGAGMTQMGKHYGFPVYVNTGLTDSKVPDAQAGLESGVSLAFSAAAGADIYGHLGICGVDQAASFDMLVMQNEVISYVESSLRKVDFSDEAFGLDVIDEVVREGSFIEHTHTAERFRDELWFPRLLDRNYYQPWKDKGSLSMRERCRAERDRILQTHRPEPVSDELDRILTETVAAAKKDLGK
jgi:trimethylamine--corrinoid protein Co-methyltransferase